MKRRAVLAASCFAVLVPVGVLLVDRGGDRGAGCSARYSATADGRLSITLGLAQAGRIEVRVGGGDVRQPEPAGASTLTLTGPAAIPAVGSVTEFTDDGQLLVCTVAPGG